MKSDFERDTKADLKARGIKVFYEPVAIPYILESTYTPDFVLSNKKPMSLDDLKGKIIVETKGFLKYDDRRKLLAVKKQYPDLDLRLIFMNNSFVYKNRKGTRRTTESKDMRYLEWAEKHGFIAAVGKVPEDWIK